MINQKKFLYVLQNEKHYTTFSADVEKFPIHQKFIDELNWNILTDFNNTITKNIWSNYSKMLNRKNYIFNSKCSDDVFDILKKEYKKCS